MLTVAIHVAYMYVLFCRQRVPAVHESSIHSRSGSLICGSANGSGSSSSRSLHMCTSHDDHYWGTLTNDCVFVGHSPPNAENCSNLHVVNEVAPSYLNCKRTKDAMSIPATLGAGSSSLSTRCPLSAGRCNVNTAPLNNKHVPTVGPSTSSSYLNRKRTRDAMATTTSPDTSCSRPPTRRHSSTGHCNVNTVPSNNDTMPTVDSAVPPSDYVHIGKCEHSCEHCDARFWYEERMKDTQRRTCPAYHHCCMAGRVVIRTYQIYLEYIKLLLRDCHFMENIRAYNQMFSITSFGVRVDESVDIGRGPYVFKIVGQLYHWLGSLCPTEGDPPRDIIEGLIELLDNHNALVQLFRIAREKLLDSEVPPFKVRLYNVVGAREYELPIGDTLGAIIYEPGPDTNMDFDIIIEHRTGQPQRVNKLHPSYMALQFPLLFVYGEDGYSKDMKMYVVTAFCAVKQTSCDYIREHQNDIRNDYLSVVYTVEFRKRGLPHCHDLIWVDENSCIQNHEDVDNYIFAELPSKEIDPEGHRVIVEFMIHGPCAVCMKGGPNCTKYFQNDYCQHTYINAAGFVHYRRRDTGSTTTKHNVQLDNRYVVPYNKQLLKTFYAYINVEHCGWTMLIKYLFKYISKGTDRIAARVSRNGARTSSSTSQPEIMVDEIKTILIQDMLALMKLNNVIYPTCRAACEALGLLGDDKEWETTLTKAASTAKPSELRTLLAHILTHCQVSNPLDLWKRAWNFMSNDIPYVASISLGIPNLHIHSSELENYTKYELEACLNHCSRSLTDFRIPLPPEDLMSVLRNRLLTEEKSYNRELLAIERQAGR
nr:helitron helicase-like domain-containing protein [Tanacetum cinerariifolium]